ncbi:Positive regulator of Tartrate dehydrogenase/decarboxylase/D-malic enzyme [Collimonas arenae]|uniref:Positive regulator of Tartrate dehydrogenase/decarboxylase/D-malic enzyme n=1 Tax=Collimonas arenae TaxID=279058 RepID=A0A0A1FA04_9BURK|nr:LysR family transcriptional regulator [Collimonas arenae]AIY41573.1 Positive regulator of Tartrate dehydrogenase/decarboxylase/D-malic enzyme [Collimonas arenae]
MNTLSDLAFFAMLVKAGSLAAMARELGVTPPAVTKRLANLEHRLGVRLLNRTTRTMSVTHEGEIYLADGARILADIEALERTIGRSRAVPKGLLRINASFGFGRKHIGPAISDFSKRFPEVEVQLLLSERPLNLADQAFDIGIRIGELPDARIIARKIASNKRLLCAAPAYLKQHPEPTMPRELQTHACIVLRENDAAYGTWHLSRGKRQETVKVRGALSSNDGETVLQWALDGHGILMRSEWDTAPYLRSGRLREVLTDWTLPSSDIFVVYPERLNLSAKVTAFVDFIADRFKSHLLPSKDQQHTW